METVIIKQSLCVTAISNQQFENANIFKNYNPFSHSDDTLHREDGANGSLGRKPLYLLCKRYVKQEKYVNIPSLLTVT